MNGSLQKRCACLISLALMTASCVSLEEKPEWPQELPSRTWYESRYAADPYNQQYQTKQEYMLWVQRFYSGWAGIPGWHSIREQVLADAEPAQRSHLESQMRDLGQRMSAEWAKASDRRRILAGTVQVWIDAANEAGVHGDHERLLQQISDDVDALIAGQLEPRVITLRRYYPDTDPPPSIGSLDQ